MAKRGQLREAQMLRSTQEVQHDEKSSDVRYRFRTGGLGKKQCSLVRRRKTGSPDQSLERGQAQLGARDCPRRQAHGRAPRSKKRKGRRQTEAAELSFGEGLRHGRRG